MANFWRFLFSLVVVFPLIFVSPFLDSSIRLNPSNAQAYLNRGIAQYNLGYEQRAIAD